MEDLLAGVAQWAVEIVYSMGYVGVFILITLINLHVLPLPTQVVLSLAGFLVGQDRFSFVVALLASNAGAIAASLLLYLLGLWIGESGLRRLFKRFERFKLIRVSDFDRAGEVFQRHGGKAIVIGHLVPGVGALISIPAGIKRMPVLRQFLGYTIVGSTLWNAPFIIMGWTLGAQWAVIERYVPIIEYAAIGALFVGVVWLLWRRRRRRAPAGEEAGRDAGRVLERDAERVAGRAKKN